MTRQTVMLNGLNCANCAAKIERAVSEIDGVQNVTLNFSQSKLSFEAEADATHGHLKTIERIVHRLEPDVQVLPSGQGGRLYNVKTLVRLGIALVLLITSFFLTEGSPANLMLLFAAYGLSGYRVLYRALRNTLNRELFDEHFLMSVATIGAIAIRQYPEAVAVMIFYEIGEYFQGLAVNRSRQSIQSLLAIRPDTATVKRSESWVTVDPSTVQVGEHILVRPGDRIPLDGIVISGETDLDTSALTGESVPRFVATGDEALSGSVARTGVIEMEVTSAFETSTVSRILALVEEASGSKATTELFITKFARYYTPVVVFSALALALIPPFILGMGAFSDWLYRGLIFLVVSCPCALVVSVPLSYFSGIGNASRNGILIKGGHYLDALCAVDTVLFDKTGTLTEGRFEVVHLHLPEAQTDHMPACKWAVIAESHSNHPIALSVSAYAEARLHASGRSAHEENVLANGEVKEISGQGVLVASGDTHIAAGNRALMDAQGIELPDIDSPYTLVYIAANGVFAGAFEVRDRVKPDAQKAVSALSGAGISVALVTGDRIPVAEAAAQALGITEVHGACLPEDKYALLESKMNAGHRVACVGDGINDAPILARASVGISMGGVGSDAAIEASDIVLMTDEPSQISRAVSIAKVTRRIVLENIIFALGIKVLIMILGALGLATMWMAIFADVGVALIAVLNAMRVLRFKPAH